MNARTTAACRALSLPLLAVLVLAGCSASPYHDAPRYAEPATRTAAARQLTQALAFGGRGYSEVRANEITLRWQERRPLSEKRSVWLDRELDLLAVQRVGAAHKPGENWEVKVNAVGGAITFVFKDDQQAARAETALRRLSRPMSPHEKRELVRDANRKLAR